MVSMAALVSVSATYGGAQTGSGTLLAQVDHLVYATPDLQAGVDRAEKLLGVRASPGGQHLGRGTRNALLALGPGAYLEIIGPDPEQPMPPQARPFRIDELTEPTLVTWAVKTTDADGAARAAAQRDVALGAVIDGSRRRSDGVMLSWRYTDPRAMPADGLIPFFIDWGRTPHPSATAAPGATLVALRAEHPDAARVQAMLGGAGIALDVRPGKSPALIATVTGPRGRVDLR